MNAKKRVAPFLVATLAAMGWLTPAATAAARTAAFGGPEIQQTEPAPQPTTPQTNPGQPNPGQSQQPTTPPTDPQQQQQQPTTPQTNPQQPQQPATPPSTTPSAPTPPQSQQPPAQQQPQQQQPDPNQPPQSAQPPSSTAPSPTQPPSTSQPPSSTTPPPSSTQPQPPKASAQSSGQPQIVMLTGKVMQQGGTYVLNDEGNSYKLDKPDKAKRFEGKTVKVTGTLDADNMLHVDEIKPAS